MMIQKFKIKGIRKFKDQKVIERTSMLFKDYIDKPDIMIRYKTPADNEAESYTLMTENNSTQGVNVKLRIGETIVVELPWLASEMDVRLCYAFLNAVVKVHRMARVMDEDEKSVRLTDCDAEEQWSQRHKNMTDIIIKGERMVVAGVNRDFYLDPSTYQNVIGDADGASVAFKNFVFLQWAGQGRKDVAEEKRHITDDAEFSSIRVVDNSDDVFIGACQYVGMMKKNTCKMVRFSDFCLLLDGQGEFRRVDAEQAFLDKMDEDRWRELFDKAEGIVKEHFRKTFIMRWNTDISNYKLCEFEEAMDEFEADDFYYEWSIWDHQKVHYGDKFYMVRTGNGKHGVVMRGIIIGTPYPDEDWSGKGRKVYYIRMGLSHMIHPDKSPLLLTTEELCKAMPAFNWEEGHSGVMLDDATAMRLDELWQEYVERAHLLTEQEGADANHRQYYQERGERNRRLRRPV